MTTFANIGEDLANIVCDFAFTTTYRDVFFSLKTYLRIQCFNMPQSLLCPRIFSQKYLRFLDSPMIVFEPISAFQDYRALFNWNEIYCRLWQLDFRRSVVRIFGSRGRWHLRLTLSWTALLEFCVYYRALELLPTSIYKPSVMQKTLEFMHL